MHTHIHTAGELVQSEPRERMESSEGRRGTPLKVTRKLL
jgi:hypothetical protein